MTSVFFSYSHADEQLRDRLDKCLAMLKHQGLIDSWHDRRIDPGDDFGQAISNELERADVILLLISPDFLASPYCYGIEMKRALERHANGAAKVIPVILRPCDWLHSPISKLRATPKDGLPITKWPNLDEAFQDVVTDIRNALPKSTRQGMEIPARSAPANELALHRSSNLRLAKTFTDADRDHYLEDTFEFMARFFENSLKELNKRNPGIETGFRRLDANQFTARIYSNGKAVTECKITLTTSFGTGISYSSNSQANSINEVLSVANDDENLFLKSGFASFHGADNKHLTDEGAAEYYWSKLIEPLQ